MSDNYLAQPAAFVDVYPNEGGVWSFSSDDLLNVSVSKSLEADTGNFSFVMASTGPAGANLPPFWSQIITPMSLVVIGMRRGSKRAVTMIGVVRRSVETQQWQGDRVTRVAVISGDDFAYFFAQYTFYTLWYLGATGKLFTLSGPSLAQGIPPALAASLLIGDPGDVGKDWFDKVMGGVQGVLSEMTIRYGTQILKFPQIMSGLFENYDVTIPFGDYFASTEGSWMSKFRTIFPFPFYEFFVTTAPSATDYFPNVVGPNGSPGVNFFQGTKFSSRGLGNDISAVPIIVARRNPLPALTATYVDGGPAFGTIDVANWQLLPVFTESYFLGSNVMYDESQVYNFYTLNPTWMRTTFGQSTDSVVPWIFNFSAAADAASINKYGFRPANATFSWMTDLTGQPEDNDLNTLAGQLLGRFASYFEPSPLMAKGQVTLPLRPDILAGCRYRYRPFKNSPEYEFYINGFEHQWVMGGPSTTTLSLSRGLPVTVYEDTSGTGMLTDIHKGNAHRLNGEYVQGLPVGSAPPLQALSMGQFQEFLSNIGAAYTAPSVP